MAPWARLRIFGALGGVRVGEVKPAETGPPGNNPGTLASGGVGMGLFWAVLHLDLARGFSAGGGWELMLSVNQAFWPWL